MTELTRLIERDPVLSARILRLANSSYFGGQRSIDSLQGAIGLIGTGPLNTLLVAGLGRLLFENSRGGDAIGSLFLLGAVAAGLLAASVNGVLRLSRHHASQGASS